MAGLLDIVRDAQLRSEFGDRVTTHIFRERDRVKGRRFERRETWQRQQQIGGGAFGQVWLERCLQGPKEGSLRAVKQIVTVPPRALRSKDFERELEALVKFSQDKYADYFVKTFGWFEGSNSLYIAMEYFAHGDLRRYMREHAPMSERDASDVCAQVLDALSDMHENHFAHRDLKPENILVHSAPPNPWWVKIGDFGISKRINLTMGVSATFHGGTLDFMAPELHGFIHDIDPAAADPFAADIWSLGETLFQMLVFRQTFGNLGLLARYVHDTSLFPTDKLHAKGTTSPAIDLICGMMQPVPSQRLDVEKASQHEWLTSHVNPDLQSDRRQSPDAETSQAPKLQDSNLAEEYLSWTTAASVTVRASNTRESTPQTGPIEEASNHNVLDLSNHLSKSLGLGHVEDSNGSQSEKSAAASRADPAKNVTRRIDSSDADYSNPAVENQLSSSMVVGHAKDTKGERNESNLGIFDGVLPTTERVFHLSLASLYERDGIPVPMFFTKCIYVLDSYGLHVPDLYDEYDFIPTSNPTAGWLIYLLDDTVGDHALIGLDFPVKSVARIFKYFLRQLPNGIFPRATFDSVFAAARNEDPQVRGDILHGIINSLPDPNYATFRALCLHLNRVQMRSMKNDMTTHKLAVIFCPIVFDYGLEPLTGELEWRIDGMKTILKNVYQIFDDD